MTAPELSEPLQKKTAIWLGAKITRAQYSPEHTLNHHMEFTIGSAGKH